MFNTPFSKAINVEFINLLRLKSKLFILESRIQWSTFLHSYLAHRIQQLIPKLRILILHQFLNQSRCSDKEDFQLVQIARIIRDAAESFETIVGSGEQNKNFIDIFFKTCRQKSVGCRLNRSRHWSWAFRKLWILNFCKFLNQCKCFYEKRITKYNFH